MRHLFKNTHASLIGMVHLKPLPGSHGWGGSIDAIIDSACVDAERLVQNGVDGLIVENMGDVPYLKGSVYPETVAAMTLATKAIVGFGVPTGVQVLAGANTDALAIAHVTGAAFIRVEGFAYAHVADEGWLDACAGELLRKRQNLDAEVQIWADIQKKHSAHSVTADLTLNDWIHGAEFCGADAVIITGSRTGCAPAPESLSALERSTCPLAIGSGITADNIHLYGQLVDALIVGSSIKEDGDWRRPVCPQRVGRLRDALNRSVSTAG
ncbi:MAG: BtpA/SgcQ family protein [Myxococcota bacterium]|nr:BtpA/SgcQ family protein [Myxococcota bacterium]